MIGDDIYDIIQNKGRYTISRHDPVIDMLEQYVIKARKEVMDNVLGECIAFSPKTREIDTPITMKLLKSYEAELKKGLNEKE